MKHLSNWRFQMHLNGGGDIWGLHGYNDEDKFVMIGTPKHFDEKNMVVTTTRSIYQLGQCAGNLEENIQEIKDTIERGGYGVY